MALARGAEVAGLEVTVWAGRSWRPRHPDAMSHTTAGKVLTDRQQGCEGGGVGGGERARETEMGEKDRVQVLWNIWYVQVYYPHLLKTIAQTYSLLQPAQVAPQQNSNTTRQYVIFNNQREERHAHEYYAEKIKELKRLYKNSHPFRPIKSKWGLLLVYCEQQKHNCQASTVESKGNMQVGTLQVAGVMNKYRNRYMNKSE